MYVLMNFKLTNYQRTQRNTFLQSLVKAYMYVAMLTATKPVYSVYCIYRRVIQHSVKFQFGPYTL